MARFIKLRRYTQARVTGPKQGFRFKVEAVDSELMPLAIFAHERVVISPHGQTSDEFVFVCSPFDLTVYPVDEPDPAMSPDYFRTAMIDAVVPAQSMGDEFWDVLKSEVCALVKALNSMDELVVNEDFICGEADSEEPDSEEPDSE